MAIIEVTNIGNKLGTRGVLEEIGDFLSSSSGEFGGTVKIEVFDRGRGGCKSGVSEFAGGEISGLFIGDENIAVGGGGAGDFIVFVIKIKGRIGDSGIESKLL